MDTDVRSRIRRETYGGGSSVRMTDVITIGYVSTIGHVKYVESRIGSQSKVRNSLKEN